MNSLNIISLIPGLSGLIHEYHTRQASIQGR